MTNDLKQLPPKEKKEKIDKNKDKKVRFIEYFKQLPVQKLAAAHIGTHEDTIADWKKQDTDFSDQIEMAKAEWALKNVRSVRSKEWLLERLMRDTFQPPQQKTDITSGGKPIPILGGVTNVQINNGNKQID